MPEVQEQQPRQEQATGAPVKNGNGQTKEADPQRRRMIRLVLLALLVIAVIVTIPVYAYYSVRESTDDAQVDGHIIPISARINGTILQVLVRDNQAVKSGDELVRLDPADYKVAVAQAEAQLATAQANISETTVNVPLTTINTTTLVRTSASQTQESQAAVASAQQAVDAARAKVSSADANLAGKRADLVRAEKDLARFKDLVDKDEISKQEYDAAVASERANAAAVDSAVADATASRHTLDQAIAEWNQAKARLVTATVQQRQSEQVSPKQQQVSEARHKQALAQAQQSQANLNLARLNLGYAILKAPVDGVVSRKTAEPGMQVSIGQQIMALVPLDDVWVTANFKETQLRKMRVGQKVEIEVDTYGSSYKYNGHIESLAAASGAKFSLLPPENATGNYVKVVQRVPVKILLEPGENHEHILRPGMSVTPTVLLNTSADSR